jgi:hypothetical protein
MRHAILSSPRRLALLSSQGCCKREVRIATPYTESVTSNSIQVNYWENEETGDEPDWEITNTGIRDGEGTALSFRAQTYSIEDTAVTFYSPSFNLINLTKPRLSLFIAKGTSADVNSDSLVISYSLTCRNNWSQLVTLRGEELTTSQTDANFFSPTSNTEWKEFQFELPNIMKFANAEFRFRYYSTGLTPVYMDEISLYSERDELVTTLFPNPSLPNQAVRAYTEFEGRKDIEFILFDRYGKIIYTETQFDQISGFKDLSLQPDIGSGMYFIRIVVDGQSTIHRLLRL